MPICPTDLTDYHRLRWMHIRVLRGNKNRLYVPRISRMLTDPRYLSANQCNQWEILIPSYGYLVISVNQCYQWE